MAVAFDAVTLLTGGANVSSLTQSHTPAGTPTAVAVLLEFYDNTANSISSVTYGGVSMGAAKVSSGTYGGGLFQTFIYGLANPLSGTQSVVITPANAGAYINGGILTVTGSDTTTVFSNTASRNDGASTVLTSSLVCTSATGELVVDIDGLAGGDGLSMAAGGSQANQWGPSSAPTDFAYGSTQAGAASVTMSWTWSTNARLSGQCAASFKAAGAGGGFFARPYYDLSGSRNV